MCFLAQAVSGLEIALDAQDAAEGLAAAALAAEIGVVNFRLHHKAGYHCVFDA